MRSLKNFQSGEEKKEDGNVSISVPSADKYDGLTREQLLETLKRAVMSAKSNDSLANHL